MKRLTRNKKFLAGMSLIAVTGGVVETQLNKQPEPTRYVLGQVTRGTIIASISGSGQVSGQNQIDITPSVSGAITRVLIKAGETVTKNTPLFEVNRKDALKAVRDAEQSVRDADLSLQSAELAYQNFLAPPDALAIVKARNIVNQEQRTLDQLKAGADPLDIKQAQVDLDTAQNNALLSEDGHTPLVVRDAYTKLVPDLKTLSRELRDALDDTDGVLGMDDTGRNDVFESLLSVLDSNRLPNAMTSYSIAKPIIEDFRISADALDPLNEYPIKIEATLGKAGEALRAAEPMLLQTNDVLQATISSASYSQSSLDSLRSRMQSDYSKISSRLTSLNNWRASIVQAEDSYANAGRTVEKMKDALAKLTRSTDQIDIDTAEEKIAEAKAALVALEKGPEAIDIAVQKNGVEQRRSSLQSARDRLADAREALNDYTIRAPFDGMVVSLVGKEAMQVTASTKLATILTQEKMVTVPLNEVDIAKVKVGQKATVTFDALPDLSIAGTVSEIDPIGTTSQGVVTYSVKVPFDTEDDQIKPGMSASVSIATDIRANVLTVPNAAIKNGSVQILPNVKDITVEAQSQGIASDQPPESVAVETGLAADQSTEIVSGLNEGAWIIIRTIVPSATTSATKTSTGSSLLPTGGGGQFRMQGGGLPR